MPLQYALHVAARNDDLAEVKAFLDRGADINTEDENKVSMGEIS